MNRHEVPHFLGIGAQKAATTWLYRCLKVHPGIWLPPLKELHYFTHQSEDRHPGVVSRLCGRDWVNRRLRRMMKPRLLSDLRSLDLVRLRASGVGASIDEVSHATQEARALSRDIAVALEAARDLRAI